MSMSGDYSKSANPTRPSVLLAAEPQQLAAGLEVTGLGFLGALTLEPGLEFAGTEVGGLSGVAYDADREQYYVLSDDRGDRPGPIAEAGSPQAYMGFRAGSYFIDIPEGEIDNFFAWEANYPNLVSAHRGGFAEGFPENAIETFEHTLTLAPALLEVDVRRTADGEWILMHDKTLNRTTTGRGKVSETALADIEALQLVDNSGNVTGFRVPTLQAALAWAEGRTILELDVKSDDFFEEVVQIVSELNAENRVRFITQDLAQATGVYRANPEIHLGVYITPENQADVFAQIESAPFSLADISAFTGTQPHLETFYQSLHDRGIVAIQGLFGSQDFFGEESAIDELTGEQRIALFEAAYVRGADAIASDFTPAISTLLGYGRSPLSRSRFYTLTLDLGDGRLENGDATFTQVTELSQADATPFAPGALDPEGIALGPAGRLFVASEGNASRAIAPSINEMTLDGQLARALPVPAKFLPAANRRSGIRNNEAFESLTLTPDGQALYTATENALYQDGPGATLANPSPSRILRYDLATGEADAEYLYLTDAVPVAPVPASGFAGNGLVELLALDNDGTLLALERSFAVGVGNNLRLYEVDLRGATNIQRYETLAEAELIRPARKRLLLDFETLGIRLDNSEGMTFGPQLADGRQTLIVVSDNNFNAEDQVTQFLAFALEVEPVAPVAQASLFPAGSALGWLGLLCGVAVCKGLLRRR